MWLVTVDTDTCDGCEECANNCPVEVFKIVDGKSDPYQADLCEGCDTCVSVCSTGAVTIKEM